MVDGVSTNPAVMPIFSSIWYGDGPGQPVMPSAAVPLVLVEEPMGVGEGDGDEARYIAAVVAAYGRAVALRAAEGRAGQPIVMNMERAPTRAAAAGAVRAVARAWPGEKVRAYGDPYTTDWWALIAPKYSCAVKNRLAAAAYGDAIDRHELDLYVRSSDDGRPVCGYKGTIDGDAYAVLATQYACAVATHNAAESKRITGRPPVAWISPRMLGNYGRNPDGSIAERTPCDRPMPVWLWRALVRHGMELYRGGLIAGAVVFDGWSDLLYTRTGVGAMDAGRAGEVRAHYEVLRGEYGEL